MELISILIYKLVSTKMNTMKKILLTAMLLSIAFTAQAQTEFSIVAGVQNATEQDAFLSQGFDTGAGYYVGLGAEFSLTDRQNWDK